LNAKRPEVKILQITTKEGEIMTTDREQNTLLETLFEALHSENDSPMKFLLETVLNAVMKIERNAALQAKPYERSAQRQGYANGFKDKKLNSRMGQLDLAIPQTRGVCFYPSSLERGLRSERALKAAIAEMYLKGVSTRKVEKITEQLCGLEISSTQVSRLTKELDEEFEAFRNRPLGCFSYVTLDAIYLKVRHNGTVIDQAVLIAYGVNAFGRREILGASVSLSEAEVHWRQFLEGLTKRGISGIQLITSDDHAGLQAARKAVFPSVPWQRCQFHMTQNALHYAPKKHMRGEITAAMRNIFNSGSLDMAEGVFRSVISEFSKKAPEFTKWLEANIHEGLTCYQFPREHQRRLRTSNGIERVNREIKRRTRVAVLFPNAESALRLVTGVLIEIHEEWVTGRQYLDMDLSRDKKKDYCSQQVAA